MEDKSRLLGVLSLFLQKELCLQEERQRGAYTKKEKKTRKKRADDVKTRHHLSPTPHHENEQQICQPARIDSVSALPSGYRVI